MSPGTFSTRVGSQPCSAVLPATAVSLTTTTR